MAFQQISESYKRLERFYRGARLPISLPVFVLFFLLVAFASAAALSYLVALAPTQIGGSTFVLATVAFLAVLSLVAAIPISIRNTRLREIEENLPDALKHMSIVLRSGGTVENALSEAAKSDYGPLSEHLERAIDRIRKGLTFEEALHDEAIESGSSLFERVSVIVTDAKKAGAGVAEVMHAIADDAREITRIRRERASRTTMHVVFIYLSALLLSPFIFGFTVNIVSFIGSGVSCAVPGSPSPDLSFLNSLLTAFIAVLGVFAAVAVGLIREGNALRYAIRAPAMVLIALVVFEVGKRAGFFLVGGGATQC